MPLISCKNVTLSYEGRPVVSGLDFEVSRGDYICILGENGSGKSTLIKGLLGLKRPSGGSIVYGDGLLSSEIGYLPQQTVVQRDFPASVFEVVLSGCLNRRGIKPFYSRHERSLAMSNMARLGIEELSRTCYRDLSGGQQQRVLLARALCASRSMLLLDEPVAGLDPAATAELYRIIDELNREDGMTIIMVSHDVTSATKTASHILQLSHGEVFFGTREQYLASDAGRRFTGGEQDD